jgi:hypothetical protein
MATSSKTLGAVCNEGLKVIGEPEITAFTATNILQEHLIEEANNTIEDIMSRADFEWSLKRTTLVTTDDITTESVAVTNASTTVTSVTDAGVSAENFTNASTAMWFRRNNDTESYAISSISDTGSAPDTLVLENSYIGTTSTATGYRIFQDTYPLSTADIDDIQHIVYGNAQTWVSGVSANIPDNTIELANFYDLMRASGGDLHRDTSGKPRLAARVSVDTSDNPRLLLWPFPTDDYILDIWYTIRVSGNTTFATPLFNADAPQLAYSTVAHRLKSAACVWNRDFEQANVWEQRYQVGLMNLIRKENSAERDASFSVATYRQDYGVTIPVRSAIYFDTKSSLTR